MSNSKNKLRHIPLHRLEMATDMGFIIHRFNEETVIEKEAAVHQAHRDDHYVFYLQEYGFVQIMLDFAVQELKGAFVGFILPGQVHQYKKHKNSGWFLAVESSIIHDTFRNAFENPLLPSQFLNIDKNDFSDCLQLLYKEANKPDHPYKKQVVHLLLNTFMAMLSGAFACSETEPQKTHTRGHEVTVRFKHLVSEKYLTLKSTADYSALLNISPSYLSEVVKRTTGFPASYWITQQIVLEAKRLLYYTDLTVKEIAFQIGYEDHAYFSRLLKKALGQTPIEFRQAYRELSNHSR